MLSMRRFLAGSSVFFLLYAPGSFAADLAAGKAKAAVCGACHGPEGVSISAEFPHLAGQVPGYIQRQLIEFKKGENRVNAIMAAQVAALSDEDMENLDAFYAGLNPAEPLLKPADIQALTGQDDLDAPQRGSSMYRGGKTKLAIPACMACHGPSGKGIPPLYPQLAGQHAKYIQGQMLAFKSGARKSDRGIMNDIAFKMSEQEISDVALFIQGLAE